MALSKLKTSQWGGSRHKSKPFVESGLLFRCLEKHEVIVKDLGAYESTNKHSSPDALGLLNVLPLAKGLITLSRCAEIHSQSMRAALSQLLMHNAEVNASKFNGTVWVNLRIERIGCVLSHYRLLARDKDSLRRCALALTASDFKLLKEVVNMIVLGDAALTTEAPGDEHDRPEVDTATVAYEDDDALEEPPSKKGRLLKANPSCASNFSVDSAGFPRMLESPSKPTEKEEPQASVVRRRLGSKVNGATASSSSNPQMSDDDKLKAALGYSTPAAKPEPALLKAKGKAKGKAKAKSLSKGKIAAVSHERLPWVKLRRCNAKNPERSYITGSTSEDGKPALIVEVSRTWSSKYMEITDKIYETLQKDGITKQEALGLRKSLCEQWP